MKKRLLFLSSVLCLSTSLSFGQALQNGDFEDIQNISRQDPGMNTFSYDSIGGYWVTGDEIKKDLVLFPDPGPFCKDTSWAYSGSHALLMRTMDIGGIIGTGNAGTGVYQFDAGNPFNSVKIGVPHAYRPEKLRGYYAYESVMNDSCWVYIFLSKWNTGTNQRDTIGEGEFVTNQSTGFSSYSLFEIPISYSSSATPDTMGILMVSSKGGYELFPPDGQPGSTLIVDSLTLVYNQSGLAENGQDAISFKTNTDHINLQLEQNMSLYAKVYDASGRLVEARELKAGENRFYLPVHNAMYMFRIEGDNYSLSRKIMF